MVQTKIKSNPSPLNGILLFKKMKNYVKNKFFNFFIHQDKRSFLNSISCLTHKKRLLIFSSHPNVEKPKEGSEEPKIFKDTHKSFMIKQFFMNVSNIESQNEN